MGKEITKLKQEVKAILSIYPRKWRKNDLKWSEVVSSHTKKSLVEVKDQVEEVQDTINTTK